MSQVRTCAYTGIFARMGLVFQSLLSPSIPFHAKHFLVIGEIDGPLVECVHAIYSDRSNSAWDGSASSLSLPNRMGWHVVASSNLRELKILTDIDVIIIENVHLFDADLTSIFRLLRESTQAGATLLTSFPNLCNYEALGAILRGDFPSDSIDTTTPIQPAFITLASAFKFLLDHGWLPNLLYGTERQPALSETTSSLVHTARSYGVANEHAKSLYIHHHYIVDAVKSPSGQQKRLSESSVSVIVPVNDESQYALNAFASPGFDEINAEIIPIRNASNAADAFAKGAGVAKGEWLLFIHQDVYFPKGSGLLLVEELGKMKQINNLHHIPIGFVGAYSSVRGEVKETHRSGCVIDRNRRVNETVTSDAINLDELAILFHRETELQIDPAFGWHCWATDLCLQAEQRLGRAAGKTLAIPIFHNSVNSQLGRGYFESAASLFDKYPQKQYITTSCAVHDRKSTKRIFQGFQRREFLARLRDYPKLICGFFG